MNAAALLTVVLLHGGGWIAGQAADMDVYRSAFPRSAHVLSLDYPLGDYRQGLASIRAVVHRERAKGRRVVAFGVSAGASYAAVLAADREVDAAVALCPVIDYPAWFARFPTYRIGARLSTAELPGLSPQHLWRAWSSPLRVLQGVSDFVAQPKRVARFGQRWRNVTVTPYPGTHCYAEETISRVRPLVDAAIADANASRR